MNIQDQIKLIKKKPYRIANIQNPFEELQLAAVRQNAYNISYIKNPTEAVKLDAVRKQGHVISRIRNPSQALMDAAIKQVKSYKPEVSLRAVLFFCINECGDMERQKAHDILYACQKIWEKKTGKKLFIGNAVLDIYAKPFVKDLQQFYDEEEGVIEEDSLCGSVTIYLTEDRKDFIRQVISNYNNIKGETLAHWHCYGKYEKQLVKICAE